MSFNVLISLFGFLLSLSPTLVRTTIIRRDKHCQDCTMKDHLPCEVKINAVSDCAPPIRKDWKYSSIVHDLKVTPYREHDGLGKGALNISWNTPNDVSTTYIKGFQISVLLEGSSIGQQFCIHFDLSNASWKEGEDYNMKFDYSGCLGGLLDDGEVILYVLPLREGKPYPPKQSYKLPQINTDNLPGFWGTNEITTWPYPNNNTLYVMFPLAPEEFGFKEYLISLEDHNGRTIATANLYNNTHEHIFTNIKAGNYTIILEPQDLPKQQLDKDPCSCLCKRKPLSGCFLLCKEGCSISPHKFTFPPYIKPDPPLYTTADNLPGFWGTDEITTWPYPNNNTLYVTFPLAPEEFGFKEYMISLDDHNGRTIATANLYNNTHEHIFTNIKAGNYTIILEPQDLPQQQLDKDPCSCLCKRKPLSGCYLLCKGGCSISPHKFTFPPYIKPDLPLYTTASSTGDVSVTYYNHALPSKPMTSESRSQLIIVTTLTALSLIIAVTVCGFLCYRKQNKYSSLHQTDPEANVGKLPPKIFIISDIEERRQILLTQQFCKFLQEYCSHEIVSNLHCNKANGVEKDLLRKEIATASKLILINSEHALLKYKNMMTSSSEVEEDLYTYAIQCLRENMKCRKNGFGDMALIRFPCTEETYVIPEFKTQGVGNFKLMDDIKDLLRFLHMDDRDYEPPAAVTQEGYKNTLEGSQLKSVIDSLDSGFDEDMAVELATKENIIPPSDIVSSIDSVNLMDHLNQLNNF